MFDVSCSLEIRSDDELLLHLRTGRNRSRVVQLSHPDLVWYRFLMHNKLSLGDTDGYTFNAKRYFSLVDELIDLELMQIQKQFKRLFCNIEKSIMALLIIVLMALEVNFLLYGVICSLVSLALTMTDWVAGKYDDAIERCRDDMKETFDSRFKVFARKERAIFRYNHSGKRRVAMEEKVSLQKCLPAQAAIGNSEVMS